MFKKKIDNKIEIKRKEKELRKLFKDFKMKHSGKVKSITNYFKF